MQLLTEQDQQYQSEVKKEFQQKQNQYEKRKFRKEYEEQLDELVPKNVGKEAILEKKRLRN